ncbi:Bifunctional DNA primase/polymerase, N-terminal [Nitrosomonas eutropha]|uniref:Bifunctional DNA primase/polymerase, N-terminal n=1 Tax=Nitrosomonas eutropha TaxID=916 RepID=A0A1I7GLS9_9PROT|nr:DUF3987 domain-containing protein [Nitrosomonas eutropha]SFU49397.1 Bifunctional DNA primase/polymerase, N-terminal [Nitrosomonas eutropha]
MATTPGNAAATQVIDSIANNVVHVKGWVAAIVEIRPSDLSELGKYALKYAELGWHVFPCKENTKEPIQTNGFKLATTDIQQIKDWWTKYPNANIGLWPYPSGLCVIDIDTKHGGQGPTQLKDLENKHGALPTTLIAQTPSGAWHYFFKSSESLGNHKIEADIDIRSGSGYVVLEPSAFIGKKEGEASGCYCFDDWDVLNKPMPFIADLPQWVIDVQKARIAPKVNTAPAQLTSDINDRFQQFKERNQSALHRWEGSTAGLNDVSGSAMDLSMYVLIRNGGFNHAEARAIMEPWEYGGSDRHKEHYWSRLEEKYSNNTIPNDMWDDPQPLISKTNSKPYPIEALPPIIRDAVEEAVKFIQAPLPMIASTALGAVSLACQAHCDVKRMGELSGPSNLFMLTIAESGERKSTCNDKFTAGIREYERKQAVINKPELEKYNASLSAWKAECTGLEQKIIQDTKKGDSTDDPKIKLEILYQKEPKPPMCLRLLYEDVTPEALVTELKKWPSGGLVSPEAGTVFGSHSMKGDSIMSTLSKFNKLWDGDSITIDRKTTDSFELNNARLTMSLQVQEETIKTFIDKSEGLAKGTGFLARFLIAWPESTMGTRFIKNKPDCLEGTPRIDIFNARITAVLETPVPIDEDGVHPLMLSLAPDAQGVWVDYHDKIEQKLSVGGEFHDVADIAAKSADNAARVAALLHTFLGNDNSQITKETMQAGIKLAEWYLEESCRFLGELMLPTEMINAAKLDEFLIRYCTDKLTRVVDKSTAYQNGPKSVRKRELLRDAISELENAGRVRIIRIGRKDSLAINPKLFTK